MTCLSLVGTPSAVRAIDGVPVDYGPIDDGHVDFTFCFEDGEWNMGLVHEEGGNPNDPADGTPKEAQLAPLIARDQPFSSGSRVLRPASAIYSFLGVGSGEPYWLFPQSNTAGVAFPGFAVCDIVDATSYSETDPRINSVDKWTTVTLKNVEYVGKKPGGGKFALWTTDSFGAPTVWMTTTNGVDATDTYFVVADGHTHPNMSFSALGLYAVTFDLTFYEGPGKTNPNTSPMVTYYFAVGTYWEWLAKHFDPTNWFLPTMVGEQADPDEDGVSNLLEYASDLDPTTPDAAAFQPVTGKGLPSTLVSGQVFNLRFPRRNSSANSQIQTSVESSISMAPLSWAPATGTETSQPLRTGWETISHQHNLASPARLFFRLRVDLLNEISY
jgi:hypothetical protein